MEEIAPPTNPITRARRHTDYSINRNSFGKEETVLKPTLSRSNTTLAGRVENLSYENLRKGRSVDASVSDPWGLQPTSSDVGDRTATPSLDRFGEYKMERRRSRTLVKKRQPWDKAPRTSVGSASRL